MAEFAGLAYFAEVPAVIWDIQRVGPSTGLPTRTGQGDVIFSYYLGHGDTKRPAFPATTGMLHDGYDSIQSGGRIADTRARPE